MHVLARAAIEGHWGVSSCVCVSETGQEKKRRGKIYELYPFVKRFTDALFCAKGEKVEGESRRERCGMIPMGFSSMCVCVECSYYVVLKNGS